MQLYEDISFQKNDFVNKECSFLVFNVVSKATFTWVVSGVLFPQVFVCCNPTEIADDDCF